MSWQSIDIIALTFVDLCALGIGLTILRRVTHIVKDAGTQIKEAVTENIAEAKEEASASFAEAVGPAITNAITTLLPLATELIEEKVKDNVHIGSIQPIETGKLRSQS